MFEGKEKTNISNDLLVFMPAKNGRKEVLHVAYFVMKLFLVPSTLYSTSRILYDHSSSINQPFKH